MIMQRKPGHPPIPTEVKQEKINQITAIGKPERVTQNRVIALFRDELEYRFVGDRSERPDNSKNEETLLTDNLTVPGDSPEQISCAIYLLKTEANNPIEACTRTTRPFIRCSALFPPIYVFERGSDDRGWVPP